MLGLKELDQKVLDNLEDKDLVNYCRINQAANRVCNDQTFWFNRLQSRFPQIDLEVMAKVKTGSWSDVYIQMVQFVRFINRLDWMRNKEEIISFRDKDRALMWTSARGDLDIVKYLVKEGVNATAGVTEASQYGHLEIVKFLVQNGANIHVLGDLALRHASSKGHLEVVKFLVQNGADIHVLDDVALRLASERGQLEVVKYLKSLM